MASVFWSWQSDLDARVTRDLVRDALAHAIELLHAEMDERPELTSDTKGVPGSPDIVATILAKIEAAAVFVGDVTPIAVSESGKALANPNVLIELGYAKKAIGLERIILIWNTAFEGAVPERLPFDLRGRRAPIGFHLPPGASKTDLASERAKLQAVFVEALRGSLQLTAAPAPIARDWQPSFEADPAVWFDPSRVLLINEDGAPGQKHLEPGRYHYMRILPSTWSAPATLSGHSPLLGPTRGYSWGTMRGGFVTYVGSLRASEQMPLNKMTLHFRQSGELWAIDALSTDRDPQEYFYADYVINAWNDFLEEAIPYLQRHGAGGPFRVRAGATKLGGLKWTSETRWGGRPQALEERAEAEFTLKGASEQERLNAFDSAWGEIAAAFGVAPPDRPTLVRQIRGF
jgi:hypothetical protein